MLSLLLDAGADAAAENGKGMTPVFFGAEADNADAVRVLLAAGADPDAADASGATPVYIAAQNGSDAALRELLKAGARVPTAGDRKSVV